MIDKVREMALRVLYEIDENKAYSNIVLDEEINKNRNKLNEKDIGLISQIVYGVTTWRLTLDTIIEKYSKIKLKKISPWILNILRMGIYQIIFLSKIPKSAAVDESVNLAKRYGHKSSAGFVNAVLRKVTINDYEELFNIKDEKEKISKTQSMPIWIIEELLKNNTIEDVFKICKNLNLKPELSIRVNKIKINKEDLIKKFKDKNIECKECDLEDFLILKNVKNIEKLEEFKQGFFTVQDESAGLSAILLEAKEGEKVLDACSAPGGKTTYIAELMKNIGEIDAWDIYDHRIKLIQDNCNRLGINIVKTKIQDASIYNKELELYDKILLDVPCLGIGVIKRKPDIKWQRKQEDIEKISKIQYKILENCSKYLKPGGELIYSTCSILQEENQNVINRFILKNKNFEIITKESVNNYPKIKKYLKNDKVLEIIPQEEYDGFFICKMKFKK